jgi:hypothetical protein
VATEKFWMKSQSVLSESRTRSVKKCCAFVTALPYTSGQGWPAAGLLTVTMLEKVPVVMAARKTLVFELRALFDQACH